ncbi:MAG: carbohydrate ABC transporter permease [Bacillota bacterium]|nr:carbohydrate ABC transporter permease [Bacillota bacterium]
MSNGKRDTRTAAGRARLMRSIGYLLAIGLVSLVFLFPIYWMLATSLKSRVQTFTLPPVWLFKPTLEHYVQVITERQLFRYMLNSLSVVVSATLVAVLLGTMAAFGFVRLKFRGSKDLAFWMLSTKMLPPIAVAVPLFLMFRQLRLLDTRVGLIWIYAAQALPLAVWLMKGFLSDIPIELEKAAMVDGCSTLGVLRRIVIPLALPGMVATALFCFITLWNEFLFALVLTGTEAKTLPVMAAGIRTRRREIWGEVGALGTCIALPVLAFAVLIQDYLVRGMTFGTVKR